VKGATSDEGRLKQEPEYEGLRGTLDEAPVGQEEEEVKCVPVGQVEVNCLEK